MDTALRALRETFGHEDFRPGQRDIIRALLAGDDVFALMPTGAGKSLLYQLPAVIGLAPVIVVSPLISLMRDQIVALRELGLAVGSLNSVNEPEENDAAMELIAQRRIKLLYVAPERLALGDTIDMLARLRPRLLAVDEAHCVSRWGHEFRPDYARIGEMAHRLGEPQTIAVTATAAPRTRADIETLLFRRPPRMFVQSFRRPNIAIAFKRRRHILKDVARVIRSHPGQSGIVYCGSRAATEALARALSANGAPALAYHAGMDAAARRAYQDEFLARPDGVMVATIAFGMGIDKENVRFVCHADLPHSVEAFYQEIGRAGRDGLAADAVAYVSRAEWGARPDSLSASALDERAQDMSAMIELARTFDCRWRTVLSALGETSGPCGSCDNCRTGLVALRNLGSRPRKLAASFRDRFVHAFDRARGAEAADAEPAPSKRAAMIEPFSQDEAAPEPLTIDQARKLATLKEARHRIARERKIAPVEIADDATLVALARLSSLDEKAHREARRILGDRQGRDELALVATSTSHAAR